MSGHSHFAESVEEYLEAVYRLEREGPGVTTSGLASSLGVAAASVSGMLKKLAKDGYVEPVGRGEVRLTQRGLGVAVRVLRRHRLAECLLTDVLGMPWDEVHVEACMLEHAISERVEDRLLKLLKNPQSCPHGQPIPPRDLSDPPGIGEPLAQVAVGTNTRVESVTEELPEILRYLAEIGLRPGVEISVLQKAPLGGPITIGVNGAQHAISLELAAMITVRE
jgi:DtxR family transcriptional regulator, Mn-dependent transcriptional regulator